MKKTVVWGAAILAVIASAAGSVETLSDGWEFSRDGGATWVGVTVPHDWAIAGPFGKTNDMQVVAIAQNGETAATEKTGRTFLAAVDWRRPVSARGRNSGGDGGGGGFAN